MQVIETARRVTGHPIPVEMGPRRAGDAAYLVADNARIQAELGWRPRYDTLDAIVETAWAWHRTHPQGYATPAPAGEAGI
jgi:UDP-glucose 4-epimerase